jgi:23S rRNA (guanosine2251-2'-O)-methyltransferase
MTRKNSHRGDRGRERPSREGARQTNSREKPVRSATASSAGKADERPARAPHGRQSRADPTFVRLYGFHAVIAALRAPRRSLIRLYATAAAAERLSQDIAARGVETRIVTPEEIAARTPRDAVHQGVLLEARPLEPIDISEVSARGLVLVLDQITDPHNFGAILRTAAAFSVDALVTTERHSPEFTGALAKSASGGLEFVPICTVVNLARALEELGDLGYWRIGLDSEASETFANAPLTRPLALVLGAEDKGLRRLTRDRCDAMAHLDLPGAIKSLNVSNACAIALALAHENFVRASNPAIVT